jgi:hypothetical protein
MSRDGEHGHVAAVGVVETVDEVQVARTTAAGTDRQLSGKVGFRSGSEGSAFLVPNVDPLDGLQTSQRVGKAVQGIPDHAVDTLNGGSRQRLGHEICGSPAHWASSWRCGSEDVRDSSRLWP